MAIDLVLATGSGDATHNTYIDVAFMDQHQAPFTESAYTKLTDDADKARMILIGRIVLEQQFRFFGLPYTQTQTIAWPRTKNWDTQGKLIVPGTIPMEVKLAQAAITQAAAEDPDIFSLEFETTTGDLKSWGTEGLDVAWATGKEARQVAGSEYALFETSIPVVALILRTIGQAITAQDLPQYRGIV